MSWISRLTNVFRGNRLDRDLADELEFHIEARTEDLIRRGMPAEEADATARRQFGNQLLLRESSQDAKVAGWLESVVRDVRFGFRMLRKDRLVSIAAIISLSLSIGACTGAFSLLDALVLRPLPVHEPGRLVYLSYPSFRGPIGEDGFINNELYESLRAVSKGKIELFGYMRQGGIQPVTFEAGGEEERVRANFISGDAFRILGIKPAVGRLLTPADDPEIEGHLAAVLSHAFWTRRFGASPAVLGRTFTFRGHQYQIAGVAEEGFTGLEPGYLTDLWLPKSTNLLTRGDYTQGWSQVWGRMESGVAPEQVLSRLQAVFTNFRRETVDDPLRTTVPPDRRESYITAPLRLAPAARGSDSLFRQQFRRPLWILVAVAGLVLLIACSNVANLFMARAGAREREIAMRLSIGAGRLRLFQQLLIESAMVALAGCAAGLVVANETAPMIVNLLAPPGFPAYLDLRLDYRVLSVVAIIGAASTLLFGLVPAWRASAMSPNRILQASVAKHSAKVGGLRPLVAVQVGFSFTVLFIAGLLLQTFQRLTNLDVGFAKDGVALFAIRAGGLPPGRSIEIERQLLDRVRQMPGVQNASLSTWGLLAGPFAPMMARPIRIPGGAEEAVRPMYLPVSPGFFDTMRIPLLSGRDLIERDIEDLSSPSVLVNESFARAFFHGQNPVGRSFEGRNALIARSEIVGLVHDAKYNNLREAPAPTVYEPLRGTDGTLEVRTLGDPLALVSTVREVIQHIDPSLRVTNVTLQSAQINNTLLSERMLALLAGFFAGSALLLAAVGLYGVISYSVARRTKEIGVRLALGAQPMGMIGLVIADIGNTIALGLVAGMAGGFMLSRIVSNILFETKPWDFWSLVPPVLLLLVTAIIAALPPAIRASRVDPAVALRYE